MISIAGLLRAALQHWFRLSTCRHCRADVCEAGRSHLSTPTHRESAPREVGVPTPQKSLSRHLMARTLCLAHTGRAPGMPIILFLHGKGGNISHRPERYAYFTAQGFGVLFVDYRGYGGSTGQPSEHGLVTDAEASYDWLLAKGVAPGAVVAHRRIARHRHCRQACGAKRRSRHWPSRPPIARWPTSPPTATGGFPHGLLISNPIDAAADIAKVRRHSWSITAMPTRPSRLPMAASSSTSPMNRRTSSCPRRRPLHFQ